MRSERIRMEKILSDLEAEKARAEAAEEEEEKETLPEVPPSMSAMSLASGISELRHDLELGRYWIYISSSIYSSIYSLTNQHY